MQSIYRTLRKYYVNVNIKRYHKNIHYSGLLGHKKPNLHVFRRQSLCILAFYMDMNNRTYFYRQSVAYLHVISNIAAQVGDDDDDDDFDEVKKIKIDKPRYC